jgi:hypothetical protein
LLSLGTLPGEAEPTEKLSRSDLLDNFVVESAIATNVPFHFTGDFDV